MLVVCKNEQDLGGCGASLLGVGGCKWRRVDASRPFSLFSMDLKYLFYQVVYSKTASVPKVEAVKSDNKDDDIDIDAI